VAVQRHLTAAAVFPTSEFSTAILHETSLNNNCIVCLSSALFTDAVLKKSFHGPNTVSKLVTPVPCNERGCLRNRNNLSVENRSANTSRRYSSKKLTSNGTGQKEVIGREACRRYKYPSGNKIKREYEEQQKIKQIKRGVALECARIDRACKYLTSSLTTKAQMAR
jgi:hypothetical protein